MRYTAGVILVLLAIVAVLLGGIVLLRSRVARRDSAVNSLSSSGYHVQFDVIGVNDRECFLCDSQQAWFETNAVYNINAISFHSEDRNNDSEKSLPLVKALPEVRFLALDDADWVTDDDVIDLATSLNGLEVLNLKRTQITSRCIESLTDHPNLTTLMLYDTAIDDDCIDALLRIQSLRLLGVRRTKISAQGLAKLKLGLPDCHIRCDELVSSP